MKILEFVVDLWDEMPWLGKLWMIIVFLFVFLLVPVLVSIY